MKLTKKEAQRISEEYFLGEIKKMEKLEGGRNNLNYLIKTKKGKYVIRIIQNKQNRERELIQLKVLKFLQEKNFPYEVPIPIKNREKKVFSNWKKYLLWVYSFIEGKTIDERKILSINKIKEIAKVLAIYHKQIRKFQIKNLRKNNPPKFYLQEYSKLKKKSVKNKIDKYFLNNEEFFVRFIKRINSLKKTGEELIVHTDLSQKNIIFKNQKIVGIIDFEVWDVAPKILDIAYTSEYCCKTKKGSSKKRLNIFLEEYKKHNKLTKIEKDNVPLFIAYDYSIGFWWNYTQYNTTINNKLDGMKAMRNRLNDFLQQFPELKKIRKV
ncbi:phosphotransferase [Candidatus Pacearchaeota archaeon]|nr:phosphotransferase [Candidatus Pacearchaeota archaeon]